MESCDIKVHGDIATTGIEWTPTDYSRRGLNAEREVTLRMFEPNGDRREVARVIRDSDECFKWFGVGNYGGRGEALSMAAAKTAAAEAVRADLQNILGLIDPTAEGEEMIGVADDQTDSWHGYRGVRGVSERDVTSFDDAVEHVLERHALDGERKDWAVQDLNNWIFGLHDGVAVITSQVDDRSCILRHTAFSQLCERAKAPPRYLRAIPGRYSLPALNWGLQHRADGPALVRLAGDEARAILSLRYGTFDDEVVFPQLRINLQAADLLETTAARVVATGLTTLVRLGVPGDAIAIPGTSEIAEIAMDFTNGEVGNRACHLAPCVYLTEGGIATRAGGVRIRHLGSTDRLAEEFRAAVPEALAGARRLRDQIAKAVDRAIADIVGEAEKLRAFGLSIAEARDVLRGVAEGAGVTLPHDTAEWEEPIAGIASVRAYDVFTAIAGLGEGKGVDRRLELEEAAAKYLARITK